MTEEQNGTTPSVSAAFKAKVFTTQAFKRFKNGQLILTIVLSVGMVARGLFGRGLGSCIYGIPCACSMALAYGFGQYTHRHPNQFGYICTGILSFIAACLSVPTVVSYANAMDRGSSYYFTSVGVIASSVAIILTCFAEFTIVGSWIFTFIKASGFHIPKKPAGIGKTLNQVLKTSDGGYRITIESGNFVKNEDDDVKMKEKPPSYES